MAAHGLEERVAQSEMPLQEALDTDRNGNLSRWLEVFDTLPNFQAQSFDLNASRLQIGDADEISSAQQAEIEMLMHRLHPWRKGPFELFGIHIDTEWRSDWKWERVAPKIAPLAGRQVLDVGCGNGYYALRMAGAGAEFVLGIDPNLLFLSQFHALTHFLPDSKTEKFPVHFLPFGLEAIPENLQAFDTVFSMGVLYHRRSPIDHLLELKGALRCGGQLVLETLVIDGKQGDTLMPQGRYAKMRNVWFLPSVETLLLWLERTGFVEVKCVDLSVTTVEEQRSTKWMTFESLPDFLDPADPNRTVEGYPAPKRAVMVATKA